MAPVVGNKAVPFLRKSATDGLWENATDFAENQQPALGKSATDFGKISHRLWENRPPTLGKNWLGFRERLARFGGNWFGFWIGLRQSLSLTVLNAKHVWVWMSL